MLLCDENMAHNVSNDRMLSCSRSAIVIPSQVNTKHLHNFYTMLDQRQRRRANIV